VFWRRGVVALLGLPLVGCPYSFCRSTAPLAPPESPRPIEGLNSPYNDYNAAAPEQSADEELIFSSDRGSRRDYDLWTLRVGFVRDEAAAIGAVKPYLPKIMSPNGEFGPVELLEHERRLVFASDRAGGTGKLDLWFYWLDKQQAPQQLPGVNTSHNDAYWTSLPQAQQAYFASDRGGSHYDIYRLSPAYGGKSPVIERVNELASPADDTAPHLFAREERTEPERVSLNPGRKRKAAQKVIRKYLLFASNRDGKDFDLYCSRLDGAHWSAPQPLRVNTEYEEFRPILAVDGEVILFSSNRPGGKGGMDLYFARFDNPCAKVE
jgi:hypothetical protein